jgi:UDP-N-acetylmuramoyl-L-alanyl-D-glutamate--2,6-diaminopimelate ligase
MSGGAQALESVAPGTEGRPSDTISTLMRPEPRPLQQLLDRVPRAEIVGDARISIAGITYRSQDVRPGWLFFCVPGTRVDGHRFAEDAAAAGAAAVVAERPLSLSARPTQVLVPSVRAVMGPVAAAFYERPAERLVVVGVTGTNGKTTTTYLLEHVFREAGMAPGVIGTTGIRVGGRPIGFDRTTPEAPDLHRLLADMRDEGVGAVAMEVSSHGLDQHRVGGMRFACAVFTNLSQDHLDYHGTLEAYFRAKALLFTPEMARRAAINHDSLEGRSLLRDDVPAVTYGVGAGAELRAVDVSLRADGLSFRADGLEVRSRLRGAFNVHNCLAALAAARQVGIDDGAAIRGIGALAGVPGRMEPVEAGQPFQVLVDYAHTPDSLENVLRAARPLAGEHRVIALFGCGGDRDRGKRPLMGAAATGLADLTVITSDNPRSEEPGAIIAEIEPGARRGGGSYRLQPDRRQAIREALAGAVPGDVVVIAGMGHETGQEFADRTIPFDDRVVAREELLALIGETTE